MAQLKESAETAAGRRGILSAVAGMRPGAPEPARDAMLTAGRSAGLELEVRSDRSARARARCKHALGPSPAATAARTQLARRR
eukprot:5835843-Prymnesium_polylepis.1